MLEKLNNENQFEYKVRICLAKLNKQIKLEWDEIVELLGEDCTGDHLRKTAYGLREYHEYIKSTDGVAKRILSISDSHVPFNLPVETFKDYANIVDVLQLNGDILDMQSISKFPKTYRVSIMEEMIQGRQYIIDLIELIKPKEVIINYGNHEMRFASYISKNIDCDLLELMPQTALDLICDDGFHHYDKRNKAKVWYEPLSKVFDGIEFTYTKDWKCKIGKTIFCHPSAFSSGMMKTAEKAMQYFLTQDRDFNALVMSHTHQIGEYVKGGITLYEQGTTSDTSKQSYTDGKLYTPQQMGCLYMCQDTDGNVIKDKTKLVVIN